MYHDTNPADPATDLFLLLSSFHLYHLYLHFQDNCMGLVVSGVCLALHNDLNVRDVKVTLAAYKRWVYERVCVCVCVWVGLRLWVYMCVNMCVCVVVFMPAYLHKCLARYLYSIIVCKFVAFLFISLSACLFSRLVRHLFSDDVKMSLSSSPSLSPPSLTT